MICRNFSLAHPSTLVQACTPRHGSSSASSQWHRTGRGDRRLQGVGQRGGHQALPTSVSYRAHQQNRAATSTTATPLNNSAVEPRRSSTRRWRTNGERTITGYSPEPVGHPQPHPRPAPLPDIQPPVAPSPTNTRRLNNELLCWNCLGWGHTKQRCPSPRMHRSMADAHRIFERHLAQDAHRYPEQSTQARRRQLGRGSQRQCGRPTAMQRTRLTKTMTGKMKMLTKKSLPLQHPQRSHTQHL